MKDMSEKQFVAALQRNGFRRGRWYGYEDTTGQCPQTLFGGIVDAKTFKTRRRSTIAHLIAQRKKQALK